MGLCETRTVADFRIALGLFHLQCSGSYRNNDGLVIKKKRSPKIESLILGRD